jgi:hypothetical protein
MTDALVRWGWPNSVAVIALAMMPVVAAVTMSRDAAYAPRIASTTPTLAGEIDVAGAEGLSE